MAVAAALALLAGPARAEDANRALIEGCIVAAAHVHRVPPALIVILLDVEGGALGRVSPNTNGTVDVGPMQVNQIWLPQVARHWGTTRDRAFRALRDSFCANVEAGTWILRQSLDEARGDFWEGVATYHSHDPDHRRPYLRSVLRQVLRLRAQRDGKVAAAAVGD
ncbi:MAG TPA: lytic transglycosylase domain-containing protein [Solirubrobacteraceae bacterium]|nr:lytic transglycosylase domain-containing protein [Solirubrobacteraceae bacterium]